MFRGSLIFAWMLALIACGRKPVQEPPSYPLYRDVKRLVHLEKADGWGVDHFELESIMPGAMDSLCRVRPQDSLALREWISSEIERNGGDAKEQFNKGVPFKELQEVLTLERINAVLVSGDQWKDDCPFWIEPEEKFTGRQILDDKIVFTMGGGGKAILADNFNLSEISGGGAGRFLLGSAVGPRWMWQLGVEFGGSAQFAKNVQGERSKLELATDIVLPLVVRLRFLNSYLESELGYLVRIDEQKDAGHGFHLGFALGGMASRKRFLIPGGALAISYEKTYGDIEVSLFKIGFRVSFDIPL